MVRLSFQSLNEYYAETSDHLVTSWNYVSELRREFSNLKAATQHDLSTLISDFNAMQRSVHASFHHLITHLRKTATVNEARTLSWISIFSCQILIFHFILKLNYLWTLSCDTTWQLPVRSFFFYLYLLLACCLFDGVLRHAYD